MEEQNKQELKAFPWKSVPDAPMIYANASHLSWTLDDLRIMFGFLKSESPDVKEYKNLEQGSVIIPWRQAKILAASLARVIADYEKRNGEIKPAFLADPENHDEPKAEPKLLV
jgi:hypothetical protein